MNDDDDQLMDYAATAALERFKQAILNADPALTHVLTGHLFIEELLDALLVKNVRHAEHLPKLTFNHKQQICRALAPPASNNVWISIGAINALRNDLTHQRKSNSRESKIARIRDLLNDAYGDTIPGDMSDDDILLFACARCAAYLQGLLDGMDSPPTVSPARPTEH